MNILSAINEKTLKWSVALTAILMSSEVLASGTGGKTAKRFQAVTGEKITTVKGGNIEEATTSGGAILVGGLLSLATVIGVFLVFIGVLNFRKIKDGNSDMSMGKVATMLGVGIALIILAPVIAWLTGAGSAFIGAFSG